MTRDGLKAAMVHEIGHFINLDHTVLNHELALDDNAGNDIYVPTMFPIAVADEEALADDEPRRRAGGARTSIPPGRRTDYVSGRVSLAGVPFQGANVVLRRNDDPLMTAYSLISGGLYFPCNPGSLCDPCNAAARAIPPRTGGVRRRLLPPGQYRVCVEQIDTRFSVANAHFRRTARDPADLLGPEECFDVDESGTHRDDPDDVRRVTAGGGPFADIVLNALPRACATRSSPTTPWVPDARSGGSPRRSRHGAGFLAAADLDVFNVPVTAGQRVRIDLDADELGSTLDAVIGFYNASNTLVALFDDAVDPDSKSFSARSGARARRDLHRHGEGRRVVVPRPRSGRVGGGTTGGVLAPRRGRNRHRRRRDVRWRGRLHRRPRATMPTGTASVSTPTIAPPSPILFRSR